jgi:hypothetical protein
MSEPTSYLRNCIIWAKPDQPTAMFTLKPWGAVIAALDGYAIIPRETYFHMLAELECLRADLAFCALGAIEAPKGE